MLRFVQRSLEELDKTLKVLTHHIRPALKADSLSRVITAGRPMTGRATSEHFKHNEQNYDLQSFSNTISLQIRFLTATLTESEDRFF